jgi:ABC-type polysaccharide/polyol phosphate transport system ATPase subunit
MSETAIKFSNISKQYRLGLVSTKTLSHDLNRWWQTSILGKEDPYLKIGETNDRSKKGKSEYVWALRDIDFEVKKGDVLGIIGKNGAGKSTLLKILSRVTTPTTGIIEAEGRIASLLEVGTGFHPELTGRENIYMNGAILGMTKDEIKRKLDEIVDFSGVERYLDTPTKRYSSGMTVRLGFAIAAHLEPEILVVDEVLAVGDAEFQKKAIGKMQDVSKGGGRTVLFVSHNMASIKSLCNRGILFNNGSIGYIGNIDDCIAKYLEQGTETLKTESTFKPREDLPLIIESVKLLRNGEFAQNTLFDFQDKIGFEMIINCKEDIKNRGVVIFCRDSLNTITYSQDASVYQEFIAKRKKGRYKIIVAYPISFLKVGNYYFDFAIGVVGVGNEQYETNAIGIEIDVFSRNPKFQSACNRNRGIVYVEPTWEYEEIGIV